MMDKNGQKFLNFLQTEKNASQHTVKNYSIDLREFAETHQKKCIEDVTHLDIRAFLASLKGRQFSKSSISRKLACIRSYFKYLVRENILETNPAANISTPKRDKHLPKFLDADEMSALLEAPNKDTWEEKRDRAILETLYSSGLRVSELMGLNHDDLDIFSGLLRVRGKGKKERIVPIGQLAQKAIENYLQAKAPRESEPGLKKPLYMN
ncbi:MAG: site-specific integrase, partial [Candidatus Omnitrophica bacterium]|nr:site-specific integrase [Candidatus Omnitrophota bacterium]